MTVSTSVLTASKRRSAKGRRVRMRRCLEIVRACTKVRVHTLVGTRVYFCACIVAGCASSRGSVLLRSRARTGDYVEPGNEAFLGSSPGPSGEAFKTDVSLRVESPRRVFLGFTSFSTSSVKTSLERTAGSDGSQQADYIYQIVFSAS